ncbi:hypothetical protein Tco_1214101 [Tanacetum coccineum]
MQSELPSREVVLSWTRKALLTSSTLEAKSKLGTNVKCFTESELTKEDRESQLYDEFERFKMLPGENVNEYYVCFHKLVNDIRNIRMTMPNIQLNSKFVNNMSPEWDRYSSKGNRIRIRGILLGEMVQQEMGVHRIELGMPMQMLLMQAQENGAVLDEEELLFLNGEQGNTFDAIGSANPQAGPSNASILSEVHILENAIDHSVSNQDEHEIHNKVQPSNVIDSTSVHMGNSNVIPYEQYLSVNEYFSIELKIYKEQVAIYEQRAKFELTEREQRMDDQMRMLIQNHNKTEENLKKELHSFKLQLKSTMENNKIIEETVTTLKQEFKQKESKFLTDFSNLKHLNDKLENKLHSQDQSIQTVHMMLNPTQVYDQKTKTALGAQNPFYLRQAKKAQPALYDGDELLKPHHVPVMVPSSEEELELAEATRNKLHVKMNMICLCGKEG